ncbi:MAG: hypothetical protein KDA41_19150, partial [Planctomycetales bacterium]|nr:hypothetical protein [Planctomycetales bacterium]
MECFFAFIVLVVVLVAVATQKFSSASGINDAYTRLAGRFGGRVTRGGWWRKPHVRFVWHGAHVLVQAVKSRSATGGYYTEVVMNWPDEALHLEVYPAGVWSRVQEVLGPDAMRIGTVPFDKHYVINADSVEGAR